MTTAIDLIAAHIASDVDVSGLEIRQEVCCITGVKCECVPMGAVITTSFTDGQLFKAPSSEWVSLSTYQAWKFGIRAEGKKRDMNPERNSCWVVNRDAWRHGLKKAEIRQVALEGVTPPWACWVTTGYKKHGTLRTPVNSSRHGVIAFNDLRADCSDPERVMGMFERMKSIQLVGFGRKIIETLECPPGYQKRYGFGPWNEFYSWAKSIYLSPLYQFVCYILPTKEEMDAERPVEIQVEVEKPKPANGPTQLSLF